MSDYYERTSNRPRSQPVNTPRMRGTAKEFRDQRARAVPELERELAEIRDSQ